MFNDCKNKNQWKDYYLCVEESHWFYQSAKNMLSEYKMTISIQLLNWEDKWISEEKKYLLNLKTIY